MTYILDNVQERQEDGIKQMLDRLSVVGLLPLRRFIKPNETVGDWKF